VVLAAGLLSALSTAADPPLPQTASDVSGARALALAAYRGLATGNDGLFTNPGALAARRRYAVELQYLVDRDGGTRTWQWMQASVVDSEMSAATGGFAYTRVLDGVSTGNLWHLALASPFSDGLFLGATGKVLQLEGPAGRKTTATADAGLFWQLSGLVGLGVVGYNLVPAADRAQAPQGMGVGLSVGDERRFHLVADWRGDFDRRGKLSSAWLVGGEILAGDNLPLRGGFVRDETRGGNWWSAGVGLVTTAGFAVDLSYRQGVQQRSDRTIAAAVKLFLHSSP
jgi:hypothetical protein